MIFRAVEDADLIQRAAKGDVEAYNLLVSRWEKPMYNYLLRITGNREDALDLTQDVLLKAYQNLGKLEEPGRFAPWLYRIAHNEAYSMFRKRRPETGVEDMEPRSTEGGITVGGSSVFPIELSLSVASALGRLSAEQREAVVLKIYRGFKFEEMAEILELSGLHRQVPSVHRPRSAQRGTGSARGTGCVMNCSPFDLKDFLLQELTDPQRRQVETHVQACPSCRLELDRLRLTQTALSSLPDEEIPRRIGFVSDQIFEPSSWRRWWAAFWGSAARMGFASAAMLSVALVVSPITRPARTSHAVEAVKTVSDAEIRQRIDAAVQHAVADIEVRYAQRTEQLVKDIQRRDQEERANIQRVADLDIDYLRHRVHAADRKEYVAAYREGESK